eukprot:9467635-Pyramimonas_sp.AAC.1
MDVDETVDVAGVLKFRMFPPGIRSNLILKRSPTAAPRRERFVGVGGRGVRGEGGRWGGRRRAREGRVRGEERGVRNEGGGRKHDEEQLPP